jgi:hypothetical protein
MVEYELQHPWSTLIQRKYLLGDGALRMLKGKHDFRHEKMCLRQKLVDRSDGSSQAHDAPCHGEELLLVPPHPHRKCRMDAVAIHDPGFGRHVEFHGLIALSSRRPRPWHHR